MELINNRIKEIKNSIANGDIEQAVIKLTFLTEDFANNFHEQAILLQGEYRRLKKKIIIQGYSDNVRNIENEIARRALLMAGEIEGNIQTESTFSKTIKRKITNDRIIFYDEISSPTQEKMLFVKGEKIEKKFNSFHLKPIDFDLKSGEITTVTGVNGSGKSTLLKIIAGQLKNTEGKLAFFFDNQNSWRTIKKNIGYLPQLHVTPPRIKTKNLLNYTAKMYRIPKLIIPKLINEYLIRLGLQNEADKYLSELSQGFRLRVELVRILMLRPKILILDEPLANLDFITRHIFIDDIRNFTNSISYPLTTIISSHNIEDIEIVSDNYIILDSGKTLFSGSKKKFKSLIENNIFELVTDEDINKLTKQLTKLSKTIKLHQFGTFQIIETKQSINLQKLLDVLSQGDIKIKHIQEVSLNSKSLLVKNYIDKFK